MGPISGSTLLLLLVSLEILAAYVRIIRRRSLNAIDLIICHWQPLILS